MIGDETLLKFSGVPLGEACSIVIRGATEQILGEAERSLHDALCVLTSTVKNTKTVLGGGNFIIKSGCGCATLEERRRPISPQLGKLFLYSLIAMKLV